MELLSSKFLISPTHCKFPSKYSVGPDLSRTLGSKFSSSPLIIRSKKSTYQDFQEYAKPLRLLPAKGLRIWRDASSLENAFVSLSSSKSESLYRVRLQTSNIYGSGLNDLNSGILLCLIDENGSSILQRLPATSVGTGDAWSDESNSLLFQRGSIDEFAFEGPHLGRILAVWIGLESGKCVSTLLGPNSLIEMSYTNVLNLLLLLRTGQWRIGGINLRAISPLGEKNQETRHLPFLQYNFELEDILLGDKGDASMMELRPHSVTAFSEDESLSSSPPLVPCTTSNEESMRDYTYLKFSLLFYDTLLILAGSAVASSTGENAGYAFLIGGVLGFAYLLLLQRSVDDLPAPHESGDQTFGNLKGSISALVLVFAVMVIAIKSSSGEFAVKLAPKELILGTMGFLMCKVSVVLAALKPIMPSLRDNK